jgi:hypothetical protein
MQRLFVLLLMLTLLLITPFSGAIVQAQTQSQNTNFLEIQGITWNHAELNILLIMPDNQSWWNPLFLNSTIRAIGQWNDAITYFSSNYSLYSYLSSVKLNWATSDVPEDGFDIYLNWTQSPLSNTYNEIGLETSTSEGNVILSSNVSLAAETSHGNSLNAIDMQNIALHELGHSLGLGHSNFTGDIMYPAYSLLSPPILISTLDVYGLSTIFAWLQNTFSFVPVDQWLPNGPVTLPTNIQYTSLPVSPQNASPQTLADNPIIETLTLMAQILIHPEISAIVIIFIAVLIIIAAIPKKKKKSV